MVKTDASMKLRQGSSAICSLGPWAELGYLSPWPPASPSLLLPIKLHLDGFFYAGIALWVLGFGIEIAADRQKANFRRNAQNKEKFITVGLWSLSRHPNYFGEIVLWLGIAVVALPALVGWQYVTLISPIFVAFLLIKVSGVKLLEKSGMERWGEDPAYRNYVASTPSLVPFSGSKNIQ